MNKPVLHILLSVCLCFFAVGQENLVPNGSFEEYSECPNGPTIELVDYWFSPSLGTPDFYNSCNPESSNYGVPINGMGNISAVDGVGYAAIVAFGFREYLGVKLNQKLESGKLYKLLFSLSIPSNNRYSVNNISVGLHHSLIENQTFNTISIEHIVFTTLECLMTSDEWCKYEIVFEAIGNEEFLYIGNFSDDTNTALCLLKEDAPEGDTFVIIDNIVMIEFDFEASNVFTPNNDGINDVLFLDSNLNQFSIYILNRWGNVVREVDSSIGWDGRDGNNNELPEGVYFFILQEPNDKKIIKTGYIHLVR